MTLRWILVCVMVVAVLAGVAWTAADDPAAADMERGAQRFLRALDAEKRAQATIAFSDEERDHCVLLSVRLRVGDTGDRPPQATIAPPSMCARARQP